MSHLYIDTYGVKLHIEVQAEALQPMVDLILPPGWRSSDDFPEDGHFILTGGASGPYAVLVDGAPVGTELAGDVALHVLDAQIRARVAVLARERIFVHAGVVSLGARALVAPGASFSGKSTLVAALVAAGAQYYSDEYAVLDHDGLVHPYPRPLSLRGADKRYGRYTTVESLGGSSAAAPANPMLIAITKYVPGASWSPSERPSGVGALTLLTNSVPAQPRAKATVHAVSRAATGSRVLEGDRGEASQAAALLLDALERL